MVGKITSTSPIRAADTHTCCGAKGRGLSLANAQAVKAGVALQPQDREHVGEAHHAGPRSAERGFPAEARAPLHHAGNREPGIVLASAEAVGRSAPPDAAAGEPGQSFVQSAEAPGQVEGHQADDDHSRHEQNALQAGHMGDGPQAPRGDVGEQHQRQSPHRHVAGDRAAGDDADEEARCPELQGEEGDREDQRNREDEEADGVAAEVVGQHLSGAQVAEAPAEHPIAA